MTDIALEAKAVEKSFGDDNVVKGIDLAVEENEILMLMGPNGVGKTVFLSCLAGSNSPTSGEVEVFGDVVTSGEHGEHIAFMLQETMAIETLTGRENIGFYSRMNPVFTDRQETYLSKLGLTDDLDSLVKHYSGGMKRKLELAMTMSMDVPIYLLDEPTAAVDMSMMQSIHDIILDRYDDGATFIISSHNPMDVDLADRLAFIPDGTVSAIGTPKELMAEVPTVISLTGRNAISEVTEYVIGGELFPVAGQARGFLPPETEMTELEQMIDGVSVKKCEPTYADLFNYHVHVRDGS